MEDDPNFLDCLYSAWNTYNSECNRIRSKWPPKESACGRYMIFSPEYEEAIKAADLKREEAMSSKKKGYSSLVEKIP